MATFSDPPPTPAADDNELEKYNKTKPTISCDVTVISGEKIEIMEFTQ
jgi:hypothetical protein